MFELRAGPPSRAVLKQITGDTATFEILLPIVVQSRPSDLKGELDISIATGLPARISLKDTWVEGDSSVSGGYRLEETMHPL